MKMIMFANDTAIVGKRMDELKEMVSKFERACQGKRLKINPGKKE